MVATLQLMVDLQVGQKLASYLESSQIRPLCLTWKIAVSVSTQINWGPRV